MALENATHFLEQAEVHHKSSRKRHLSDFATKRFSLLLIPIDQDKDEGDLVGPPRPPAADDEEEVGPVMVEDLDDEDPWHLPVTHEVRPKLKQLHLEPSHFSIYPQPLGNSLPGTSLEHESLPFHITGQPWWAQQSCCMLGCGAHWVTYRHWISRLHYPDV